MREVILVGAPWCGACKAMKAWFDALDLPGITTRYADIEEASDEVFSLPTVLFEENGNVVQRITGAIGKHDLEHVIKSLWA